MSCDSTQDTRFLLVVDADVVVVVDDADAAVVVVCCCCCCSDGRVARNASKLAV